MAMFVHLTRESRAPLLQRNGIRMRKAWRARPGGVYAVPVTRNFFISHQWLRELRRGRPGALVGVYFRIPDEELVWVGHYGTAHQQMTAAEAVAEFMAEETREGWEVLVPRRIEAKEIHRVRTLPQVLGWRYRPGVHGTKPCPCSFCSRGSYGARRLRERYGTPD
jgi:hypothetical protein